MSVQLQISSSDLHLADEFPEMGVLAPPSIGGGAVVLVLDVEGAEAAFAQAPGAGAKVPLGLVSKPATPRGGGRG